MAEQPRPVQVMRRILVVEDDYALADLLVEVLVHENCTAEIAPNGLAALEQLRAGEFDAVVCDLMLPRLDGERLHRQVAQDYPHLADKFLFITGHAARRSGVFNFVHNTGNSLLEKPFEIEQFRSALQELFAR